MPRFVFRLSLLGSSFVAAVLTVVLVSESFAQGALSPVTSSDITPSQNGTQLGNTGNTSGTMNGLIPTFPGQQGPQGQGYGYGTPNNGMTNPGMTASPHTGKTQPVSPLQQDERLGTIPSILSPSLPRPFGAALFDSPIRAISSGPNPDYIIQVGDQIIIQMWGSTNVQLNTKVDHLGNIFIPEVGPITVAGVRAGDVSSYVESQVMDTYKDNVAVYVTLAQWQSIGVFVSGFVKHPGRFPGTSNESILEYLSRAGGIDEGQGSFRDIQVMRNGKTIARVDLYEFLTKGAMPNISFRDKDTIVVGPQRPTIVAEGAIRNSYRFETPVDHHMQGSELVHLARPLPQVTHVLVYGTRDGKPFSRYQPLGDVQKENFGDQDAVAFYADAVRRSLTIEVSGARLGRSVFVTDPDVTLLQMLNYIEIDPTIADVSAVHLRRKSVARQQKGSLDASLQRLERALFNVSINTDSEAAIRMAEANLVARYIERARTVEPDGTVVVLDSNGKFIDMRLEDGDEIVIPEKRSVVIVSGEVMVPQAVAYEHNYTAENAIERAGGLTDRGDSKQIILRKTNGQVFMTNADIKVSPGDEIIVPPTAGFKGWQFGKDLMQLAYQIAFSAGVILK